VFLEGRQIRSGDASKNKCLCAQSSVKPGRNDKNGRRKHERGCGLFGTPCGARGTRFGKIVPRMWHLGLGSPRRSAGCWRENVPVSIAMKEAEFVIARAGPSEGIAIFCYRSTWIWTHGECIRTPRCKNVRAKYRSLVNGINRRFLFRYSPAYFKRNPPRNLT
jgi:hypothetical protein